MYANLFLTELIGFNNGNIATEELFEIVNKIGQLLHTSAFSFGNKLYFGSQLPWTTWLSRARDLFPSYRKNFFFGLN